LCSCRRSRQRSDNMPLTAVVPLSVEVTIAQEEVSPFTPRRSAPVPRRSPGRRSPRDSSRVSRMLDRFKVLDKMHGVDAQTIKQTPPPADGAWWTTSVKSTITAGCLMSDDSAARDLLSRLMNDPLVKMRTPPKPKPPMSMPAKRMLSPSSLARKKVCSPTYLRWSKHTSGRSPSVRRWTARRARACAGHDADALDEFMKPQAVATEHFSNRHAIGNALGSGVPVERVQPQTGDALDAFMGIAGRR